MTRPDYFTGTGWLERHYDPNTYAAMTLEVLMTKRGPVVMTRLVVDERETAPHEAVQAMMEEMARNAERF